MRRSMTVSSAGVLILLSTLIPIQAASATHPAAAVFHVSPSGDDSGSGALSDPFESLPRAQEAVREARADGGKATVYLREGTYRLSESVEFSEEDSGDEGSPVVWSSYPGEQAIISGGLGIPATDFQPVSDEAVLDRLQPAAQGTVVELDLAAAGVDDFGVIEQSGFGLPQTTPPPEFFVNGGAQTLARYPNEGTLPIGEITDPGGNARSVMGNPELEAIETAKPSTFGYSDPRPESWANTDDVWMFGYWFIDWADGNLPLASVDSAAKALTTGTSSYYGLKEGQQYYYYNVLEELDSEGEYYLDRTSGMLYYYPAEDFSDSAVELSLIDTPLMTFTQAHDIDVTGVTLENGRSDGIRALNSDRLAFTDVKLQQLGRTGIVFGLREDDRDDIGRWNVGAEGGSGNVVDGATISRTGTGGVFLGGGDRQNLSRGENRVVNSDISEFSRLKRTYSPAVQVAGVGNTIRGNYFHDAPHIGILIQGNDHHIAENEIARVMQETGDGGAIYLGRDFTETGHIVERNYIHDVDNTIADGPKVGVYLDDLASGLIVRDNVVQNAGRGILVGGGRENLIERNVIVDASDRPIFLDARGFGFAAPQLQPGGTILDMLEKVPYQSPPWSDQYSWLPNVLDNEPAAPVNTRLLNNVIVNSASSYIEPAASPYVTESGTVTLGGVGADRIALHVPAGQLERWLRHLANR